VPQNRLEDARCVGALLCLWLVVTIVLLSVATLTIINTNLSAGQVKLLGKLFPSVTFSSQLCPTNMRESYNQKEKSQKVQSCIPCMRPCHVAGWSAWNQFRWGEGHGTKQQADNFVGQGRRSDNQHCSLRVKLGTGFPSPSCTLCKMSVQESKFPLAPMGVLAPGSAHARPFSGSHVCRVTFKQLPQPLRNHISSFCPLDNF
jgi:hypothetical protein